MLYKTANGNIIDSFIYRGGEATTPVPTKSATGYSRKKKSNCHQTIGNNIYL